MAGEALTGRSDDKLPSFCGDSPKKASAPKGHRGLVKPPEQEEEEEEARKGPERPVGGWGPGLHAASEGRGWGGERGPKTEPRGQGVWQLRAQATMLLQPSPCEGGCGGRLGRRQSSDHRAGRSTVALGAERRKHLYLLSFFLFLIFTRFAS